MRLFTHRFLWAAVLSALIFSTPSNAAKPQSCLLTIAAVTMAAALGLNGGTYVRNLGRIEGYQRALADVSEMFEKRSKMKSGDEDSEPAIERYLKTHRVANHPYFRENLAALIDSERDPLRVAVIHEKLRLLNEIFQATTAESVDHLLERTGLPKEVIKEIKEKGLFDGYEFWKFELEGEEAGEYRINLFQPNSIKPYFEKLRQEEQESSKRNKKLQGPTLSREV